MGLPYALICALAIMPMRIHPLPNNNTAGIHCLRSKCRQPNEEVPMSTKTTRNLFWLHALPLRILDVRSSLAAPKSSTAVSAVVATPHFPTNIMTLSRHYCLYRIVEREKKRGGQRGKRSDSKKWSKLKLKFLSKSD